MSYKSMIIFLCLLCLVFVSCSSNCDDKMSETRSRYGSPEEVNSYSSGGYNSVDWWYWSKGIEFGFTWGKNVDGCQVSTYTFNPIGGVVTDDIRAMVEDTKVLESVIYCPNTRLCD